MLRFIYCVASMFLAWLLMQAVHEFGHVVGAWTTGGRVTKVVLHPLAISRTDVEPNPSPFIEVWAGPIAGVLIPLAAWLVARQVSQSLSAWLRFFAGFCLIANGCYLGYGVIEPIGDAEELVRLGTPAWLLGLLGLICAGWGLRLWHGLGREFGLGRNAKPVSFRSAAIATAASLATIVAEACLSTMN